ncbi:MAG: dicarboxylate/amino acid:cation symporter [Firmicutes bacterium]|nr:dicarboxylate/amino acid:cation symporter [Bacillota bacterium]
MLMFEESLIVLMDHAESDEVTQIRVKAYRVLDTMSISLTVPGEEFSFAKEIVPVGIGDLFAEDSDGMEAVRNLLLQSFGDRLRYKHRNGRNTVRIQAVRSTYSFLYQVMACLLLAVILGVLCRAVMPEAAYLALNDTFLESIRTMFLNALKIVIAPIVFLSIVVSIAQFNSLSEIGRLGGKLMLLFLMLEAFACVISGGIYYLTRIIGLPFAGSLAGSGGGEVEAAAFSIRDMLINIVPSNFVQPFLESNVLQLMFLGVLCGLAVGSIGDYSRPLQDFFKSCYELFIKATGILTRFIPILVLCSIWSLILTTGTGLLFSLAGILLIVCAGILVLLLADTLRLKMTGLSVSRFLSKYTPAMAYVFSTASSTASLPENMKSAKSLGISERLYSLSLPLGVIFSKNASIFYRSLTVLLMAQLFGVEATFTEVISLLVTAAVITLATPGVPGGAYIAFSALIFQMGLPAEALACVISIDAVMDLFIAAVNCYGTMVSTLTVAQRENMLDLDQYNDLEKR